MQQVTHKDTMSNLRHPYKPAGSPPTGCRQYVGKAPLGGPGITRSCDRCGQHRVQAFGAYIVRPTAPGQERQRPAWLCAACNAARVARVARVEEKASKEHGNGK